MGVAATKTLRRCVAPKQQCPGAAMLAVHCLYTAGIRKPIDVASANGKSFLNMATGGFGTEAAKQTDSDLKDKVGGAAYLITGEPIQVLSPLSAASIIMLA